MSNGVEHAVTTKRKEFSSNKQQNPVSYCGLFVVKSPGDLLGVHYGVEVYATPIFEVVYGGSVFFRNELPDFTAS